MGKLPPVAASSDSVANRLWTQAQTLWTHDSKMNSEAILLPADVVADLVHVGKLALNSDYRAKHSWEVTARVATWALGMVFKTPQGAAIAAVLNLPGVSRATSKFAEKAGAKFAPKLSAGAAEVENITANASRKLSRGAEASAGTSTLKLSSGTGHPVPSPKPLEANLSSHTVVVPRGNEVKDPNLIRNAHEGDVVDAYMGPRQDVVVRGDGQTFYHVGYPKNGGTTVYEATPTQAVAYRMLGKRPSSFATIAAPVGQEVKDATFQQVIKEGTVVKTALTPEGRPLLIVQLPKKNNEYFAVTMPKAIGDANTAFLAPAAVSDGTRAHVLAAPHTTVVRIEKAEADQIAERISAAQAP